MITYCTTHVATHETCAYLLPGQGSADFSASVGNRYVPEAPTSALRQVRDTVRPGGRVLVCRVALTVYVCRGALTLLRDLENAPLRAETLSACRRSAESVKGPQGPSPRTLSI